MKLPLILYTISNVLTSHGAQAIIVGGAVRDYILNTPVKDYDIEVYNIESIDSLQDVLANYGSINLVGKSFGILKLVYDGSEYDFSIPRTESKSGMGHKGFKVKIDGNISFKKAAKRRDFTINSMGYDIKSKTIIDPYNAQKDIRTKTLRHIDDHTFIEDPLRVYRAIQFAARFEMQIDEKTKELCTSMISKDILDELPKERVYEEWKKLLLKSKKPSIGFELMRDVGIIERYFPELHALIGVIQSPKWHPEGDVWTHTMMALDKMTGILKSQDIAEKEKLKLLFSILCHDLGKPSTTTIEKDGRIRAIGHEKEGVEPTCSLLRRLTDEHSFIKSILPLVEHHLKPSQFYTQGAKASTIRRLAVKVNIEELRSVTRKKLA